MQQSCEQLGLSERTRVLDSRAEALARDRTYRDSFAFANDRSVGALALVIELALPFLKIGVVLFAQKSQKQADEEIQSARKIVTELGGTIRDVVVPNAVAVGKAVAVIEVAKVTPTPAKFPRPTAQLQKSKKRP